MHTCYLRIQEARQGYPKFKAILAAEGVQDQLGYTKFRLKQSNKQEKNQRCFYISPTWVMHMVKVLSPSPSIQEA